MQLVIDGPRLEQAIAEAERRTSGEIVVSLAPWFWGSVELAARRAFARLGVARTRERNGVLLFMVPARRRFVILGDVGVYERAGPEPWREIADRLERHLRAGDNTVALVGAIGELGDLLARHFPPRADDVNELPDAPELRDQPEQPERHP